MNKIKKGISVSLSFIILMFLFIFPNNAFADNNNSQYCFSHHIMA